MVNDYNGLKQSIENGSAITIPNDIVVLESGISISDVRNKIQSYVNDQINIWINNTHYDILTKSKDTDSPDINNTTTEMIYLPFDNIQEKFMGS